MYYGSKTAPPCTENVIHIVLDKPLSIPACQFKLLRENSLISSRPKEIHTRVERPLSDRTVYTFNKQAVSYSPSIMQLAPLGFNKFLLANGYGYKMKMIAKQGLKGLIKKYGKKLAMKMWRQYRRWAVKKGGKGDDGSDLVNCDLPEMDK